MLKVEDEQGVPLQKYSFRKISELQDIEKDVFIGKRMLMPKLALSNWQL